MINRHLLIFFNKQTFLILISVFLVGDGIPGSVCMGW